MKTKNWLPNLPTILLVLLVVVAQQVWAGPLAGKLATNTAASSSTTFNYQGYLTDSGNNPVTDSLDIVVRLYDVETNGTALWSETHNSVPVTEGLFSLLLGSIDTLDQGLFDDNESLWIGITVGSDEEMVPRERLPRIPFDPAVDLPSGIITMWSGTLATIPDGWALCDGANGTPDLRDRFVTSISGTEDPGDTGGDHLKTLSVSNLPSHTHPFSTSNPGSHTHSYDDKYTNGDRESGDHAWDATNDRKPKYDTKERTTDPAGAHSHSGTTNPAGGGTSFDIRPKYYKLAFIMKQ